MADTQPRTWFKGQAGGRAAGPGRALVVVAVLFAGAPVAAVAAVAGWSATTVMRRRWWACAPATVLSAAVSASAVGFGEAASRHIDGLAATAEAVLAAAPWADGVAGGVLAAYVGWLPAQAPLGVPAGLMLAVALSWVSEKRRPSWQEWEPRRGPLSHLAERRLRGRIRSGSVGSEDGAVIGVDGRGRKVVVTDRQASGHTLVVGASGSGKSTTVLTVASGVVRRGLPLVMVDMKGSAGFADSVEDIAARNGRPFVRWSVDGPLGYNPLSRGGPSQLKDLIVGASEWTEPHYKAIAEQYLQVVFQVLADPGGRPPGVGGPVTVDEVAELLTPSALVSRARKVHDADVARRAARTGAEHAADGGRSLQGLPRRLRVLTESDAGRWLRPNADGDALDLAEAVRQSAVVMFSIDGLRYPEVAQQVGQFVVQDLKTVAADLLRDGNAVPLYVMIDEFSVLGGTHLLGLIARGREAGVRVVLSTQELSDLQTSDPHFVKQVLGNTTVKIVHRQEVLESAEVLAATAGTTKGWERRTQVRRVSALPGFSEVGAATGAETVQRVDESRVEPSALQELSEGVAYLIVKHPELYAGRVDIIPPVPPPPRDAKFDPSAHGSAAVLRAGHGPTPAPDRAPAPVREARPEWMPEPADGDPAASDGDRRGETVPEPAAAPAGPTKVSIEGEFRTGRKDRRA